MKEADATSREPRLRYLYAGAKKVKQTHWDDLVLDPSIVRLLQNDYESFFRRETWFRDNGLAFRRGYLLFEPPGNGKTSAIRAMLCHAGITGHTINLFRQGVDDDDLTTLFETAATTAPAIVVLEDIDTYFDRSSQSGPEAKVSLQHLLNCLDGATTRDGVIVVATANNPKVLDPAILRRPGRFDRVVGFPNPTKELRAVYFGRVRADLDAESIVNCADASEGFSFAQLQESYLLAGQEAFQEEREVTAAHILGAISTLRLSIRCGGGRGEGVSGFS